jgi:haloalkane dehalogenase
MTVFDDISSDFPFESKYIDILDSKIHYIDEGTGDPVLFLHGNPPSSYLWRNIIPLVTLNARCIAMDLIGMGKSEKKDIDYRLIDHVKYVEGFIEKMNLKNLTLVIHDWGSALGFHYATRNQENIKGIAFMESILAPVSSYEDLPEILRKMFQMYRSEKGWGLVVDRNYFIEQSLPGGIVRKLTDTEMNYYREPYKESQSRKPLWVWPNEVPIEGKPEDVVRIVSEYNKKLQQWDVPKLLFYANPGTIFPKAMVKWCQEHLTNLTTVDLGKGYHFLQEDHPIKIGEEIVKWLEKI